MTHQPDYCFGSHLSVAGGVQNAISDALRLGFQTVQVFVKNQRQWQAAPLKPADREAWFSLRRAHPNFGPIVAHGTYLINLASADSALYQKSRAAFQDELRRCGELEIAYLVFHPGSPVGSARPEAIARVADALSRCLSDNPGIRTMPLVECTAGQGDTLGRTVEELGEILRLVGRPGQIGVCIDTCHAFAAGYDIRSQLGWEDFLARLDAAVGLEQVRCWHLNDSLGDLGSRLDRHAHLGKGKLGRIAFKNVLSDRRFRGLPMILETPKGMDEKEREWDRVNLSFLKRLQT